MDSYYKYHVFFCLNQRDPGAERPSCANCNAQAMQEHAKKRVKQLGLAGPGQVRINKAGCLERCELGPALVVYPEGVWYTYVDESDIDEIVDSHLVNGKDRRASENRSINLAMNVHTKKYLIDGPVGKIEVALDLPDDMRENGAAPRGIALVAHPHPLFGGTMDNKVAQTLARTLVQLNYVTYRSNFRGVGETQGEHDAGIGERDDLRAVLDHMRAQAGQGDLPLVLAGFSFGTFVLSHVAAKLREEGQAIERIVFVGTAASRWEVAPVPENTLVIHGETDETVPIQSVYDWARPQELPVVVIPGAEHFLHRKLHVLKRIIVDAWR